MSTTAGSDSNKSSLRIGFFTDFYLPVVSGIAVSLQLLAKHFREAGHQVTIFAPKFPGHQDTEPMVRRIPSLLYMNKPTYYVAVPGTPRTTFNLTRSEFDVLHVHSPLSVGMMAYFTARAKGVPLIYTYHTALVDYTPYYLKIGGKSRVVRWGAKLFSTATANLCDYIVTPSDKFKRALLEQNVKRPIHTIPNGINLTDFKSTTKPGIFRTKLGLKSDAPILLSVGRADPEKRLDFLIDAFVLLSDRIPDAHLVFAGDGSALNKLKEHAASTKVNHRIHFLGMVKRNELPDLLHDGTIFLSACTNEVHPIAVLEAIAAGLPIIVVQDEAFEGMVENDLNGYMTPLDVNIYADTIIKLLQDKKKLETFGKHSALLSEKYSIESQVNMLEQLYREAISEK